MNRKYSAIGLLYAGVVLVAACERGAGELQGGIEGSGRPVPAAYRITTLGAVESLGSIVVNDVEYDLAGATITIDGAAASEADLAPGLVTIVEGELAADGMHGTAKRVTVEIAVAGSVSAVDVGLNRVTILGQAIEIDESTSIDIGLEGSALGGLGVGRDVQVSGFVDAAGVVHARRIETRKAGTPPLVSGYIASLDAGAHVFSINGQRVSYENASLTGFDSGLYTGASVRVAVQGFDRDALVAQEIRFRDQGLPGIPGDAATLEGLITRFGSPADFDVGGHPVVAPMIVTSDIARLGAFVKVSGDLLAGGIVSARNVVGIPGHLAGVVIIDNVTYSVHGPLTPEGAFRLNIAEDTGGAPESDSGLGQLVGTLKVTGGRAYGTGVIIGEGCALSVTRFCGTASSIRIDLAVADVLPAAGSIRVATNGGEELWSVQLGYWGGRGGFDPNSSIQGLYDVHQVEFARAGPVVMSIDRDGRMFFQSAETGCTGNGTIVHHEGAEDLYDVTLTIAGCNNPFAHLNADFEGLSTPGSMTPWDYDGSVHRMWLSTRAGSALPAAITLWASAVP
jgi:hypothetical protein